MRRDRLLTPAEKAVWRKVASTVHPLEAGARKQALQPEAGSGGREVTPVPASAPPVAAPQRHFAAPARAAAPLRAEDRHSLLRPPDRHGLDAGWDRRLARGLVEPDFTLDLHGATLDAAYARLGHGLAQARTMGARVVLLITGRSRPVDAADRGRMRGAIRAKIVDWLAAGEHGAAIAAIRPAHRRHGGPGALYLILRRRG